MAEIKADMSHHHSLIVSEPDVSDPKLSKSKRLASLDIFRGLTVSLMILVDDASEEWLVIGHAPWNGYNLADFVMPFFLFIVGMSIALSLKLSPIKPPKQQAAQTTISHYYFFSSVAGLKS
ncbi:hypothetical protein ACFX11_007779 [Malus domestica]